MYIPLAGFTTHLIGNISWKTRYVPIPQDDYDFLIEQLADEDYSFLEVKDGNAIEIVKVINICDKLVIDRGVEQTRPLSFRCGTKIAFIMTMQGVKDTVCQMETCNA